MQQSITTFKSGGDVSNRSHPNNEPTIEEISKKLDKVLAIVSPRVREETTSFDGRRNSEQNGPNPRYQDAKNLLEFLDVCPDIEILSISHKPGKEIKCKICDEYLHCKPGISKATASRLPTGKDAGCLSTGLKIDDSQYQYYVTGDKSTNHRITNQATLICPVVNGERQAIFLDAQPVYEDSYGTGGTGDELAKKILKDLKRHPGVEDERILFMAGKVTDGQYINEGFVERMNNALWEHLPPEVQDEFWWPLQWDPAHWLDKVFDKFMDSEFVSRLLMRTKLFHTLFSYRKMHSVAKATAEEHDLPFRTTISFAKQRFFELELPTICSTQKQLRCLC